MCRIIFLSVILFIATTASAQQKEGRVTYQRTMELNITISGNPELAKSIPKTRTNMFELNFSGTTVSWQQVQELQPEESGGPGLVLQFAGMDDLNWFDLATSRRLQQTELGGKIYLISDSIRAGNWKISDETKTILGHACRKATSKVISKRMITAMENGKLERREMPDTSISEAWFTSDVPVSAGPEIQGQLPGLVLELSTRSGKVVYTATAISPKAASPSLKQPAKGKKVTMDEFAKERIKMMEQMQQGAGTNRIMFSSQ